jgi:hypothetical protein
MAEKKATREGLGAALAELGEKYRSKGGAIRNFMKTEKAIPDVSRFTATLYWG